MTNNHRHTYINGGKYIKKVKLPVDIATEVIAKIEALQDTATSEVRDWGSTDLPVDTYNKLKNEIENNPINNAWRGDYKEVYLETELAVDEFFLILENILGDCKDALEQGMYNTEKEAKEMKSWIKIIKPKLARNEKRKENDK